MVADGRDRRLRADRSSTTPRPTARREIADELAAADRHVRVIHHERNRKLGGSIKTGFANATRRPRPVHRRRPAVRHAASCRGRVRLLREYEADIVSAYRFDRTGEGYLRAIYTFFYNLLIRWMFGVKARDINFAFKLCRRRIFDSRRAAQRGLVHRRRADHPGAPASASRSSSSASTTSRARGASRRSARRRSSSTILREMFKLRGELKALQPVARDR